MKKKMVGIFVCMLMIAATVLPVVGNEKIGDFEDKLILSNSWINRISSLTQIPPDEEWNKTVGGLEIDELECVQQTDDGGYIMTGCTESFGPNLFNFWLVKIKPDGNLDWYKTYGSAYGYSVKETSDGGYILAGYHWATQTTRNARLIKTDSSGNLQWDKSFGGPANEWLYSVNSTGDGGFILAGMTNSFGAGGYDIWLIKTDSIGNEQWNRTFGGIDDDAGRSALQVTDGFILAGSTNSYGAGMSDFWLIKTNSNGFKQWDILFGGTEGEFCYGLQQTTDGEYLLTGYTQSYGAGNNDVWLIGTDSSGNEQMNKTFGGTDTDVGYSVQQTDDEGYVIAGYTKSYGAGAHDVWLIKTDSNGNEKWNKTFGGTDFDEGRYMTQTADGGFAITGHTMSYGTGLKDGWLIKTYAEEAIPDLMCEGSLSWIDVKPGTTVNGSFIIKNIGDSESLLDWEKADQPSWGKWTLDPESGSDLTPEDGAVTVQVTCVAPNVRNKNFTGMIKIVNKENSDNDYCYIDASLTTPKNRVFIFDFPLLNWLLNRFPNTFPILRQILG